MAWSEDVKAILSCGISLSEMGVNNWALTESEAIQAPDKFESLETSVLGGDVYEMVDDEPESIYDNWYCERDDGEELGKFVARSIKCARQYICNYRNPSGRETLYCSRYRVAKYKALQQGLCH